MGLAILQWFMAGIGLLAALFLPKAGEAALLYPLDGKTSTAINWTITQRADLLGVADGRAIVRIPTTISIFSALGHGLVPLTANGAACSTNRKISRID